MAHDKEAWIAGFKAGVEQGAIDLDCTGAPKCFNMNGRGCALGKDCHRKLADEIRAYKASAEAAYHEHHRPVGLDPSQG